MNNTTGKDFFQDSDGTQTSTEGTKMDKRNWKAWLAILATLILAGFIMNACGNSNVDNNDMNVEETDSGVVEENGKVRDWTPNYESKQIINEVFSSYNGVKARAYEQVGDDRESVISYLEIGNSKVVLTEACGIYSFSLDGRYLLYCDTTKGFNRGLYVYDLDSKSRIQISMNSEPLPNNNSAIEWADGEIKYTADGKNWNLKF